MRTTARTFVPLVALALAGTARAAQPEAAEGEVTETVTEAARPREGLVAPTLTGGVGLIRVLTTEVGARHHFRVGLHGEYFTTSQFLVQADPSRGLPADDNSRAAGELVIGYSPLAYLEAYLAFISTSNSNTRHGPALTQVVNSLGDFVLGAKGRFPVSEWASKGKKKGFELGLDFNLRFFNGVDGIAPDADSTSVATTLVASLDFATLGRPAGAAPRKVPLRMHLNLGYTYDGSANLLDIGARPTAEDMIIAQYAYGINSSRLRVGLGIDAPFEVGKKHRVLLSPMLEYRAEIATGDGAEWAYRNVPQIADGTVAQYLAVAARVRPVRGLYLDLGVELGLQSEGAAFGPAVAPWNLIFGLGYAYDPVPAVEKRTRVVTKAAPAPAAPSALVRGSVINSQTRAPVAGAVIYFAGKPTGIATATDGSFESFPMAPGETLAEVSAAGYDAWSGPLTAGTDLASAASIELQPRPPADGRLHGVVTDATGKAVAAIVRLVGPRRLEIPTAANGIFESVLPPGSYVVRIAAADYLARERSLVVPAGGSAEANFALRRRPKKPRVELGRDLIKLTAQVKFVGQSATLQQGAQALLDEVVDLLLSNPQVRKVRVEAHCEPMKAPDEAAVLTQQRAEAVIGYLSSAGIGADRLEARGMGATKPLFPTTSRRNRERNRRIELHVVSGELPSL